MILVKWYYSRGFRIIMDPIMDDSAPSQADAPHGPIGGVQFPTRNILKTVRTDCLKPVLCMLCSRLHVLTRQEAKLLLAAP